MKTIIFLILIGLMVHVLVMPLVHLTAENKDLKRQLSAKPYEVIIEHDCYARDTDGTEYQLKRLTIDDVEAML